MIKPSTEASPCLLGLSTRLSLGRRAPAQSSDHRFGLCKAMAEQWFAAELSGKEMGTRKRERSGWKAHGDGRGERHCCSFLRLLPLKHCPYTMQGCPGLSYGVAHSPYTA